MLHHVQKVDNARKSVPTASPCGLHRLPPAVTAARTPRWPVEAAQEPKSALSEGLLLPSLLGALVSPWAELLPLGTCRDASPPAPSHCPSPLGMFAELTAKCKGPQRRKILSLLDMGATEPSLKFRFGTPCAAHCLFLGLFPCGGVCLQPAPQLLSMWVLGGEATTGASHQLLPRLHSCEPSVPRCSEDGDQCTGLGHRDSGRGCS